MERYKRYYGLLLFIVLLVASIAGSYFIVMPQIENNNTLISTAASKEQEVQRLEDKKRNIEAKKKKIADSMQKASKKLYSPAVSDLGSDSLFFTLCNDVIEMIHANSVKIESIKYEYNPESDPFVKFSRNAYFVCNLNLKLVSNYVNLGKLIQDIYQYPYYIKINKISVKPYIRDKKILKTDISLSLYAHTEPEEESDVQDEAMQLPSAE